MNVRTLQISAVFVITVGLGVLVGIGTGDSFETSSNLWPAPEPPVIEVTALDYAFAVQDSIPSGWVTFKMTNKGEETHEVQFHRLPDGRTFAESRQARVEPMDSIQARVRNGTADSTQLAKVREAVPDWAWEHEGVGGVAPLDPGHTSQVTDQLAPGQYVMVCNLRAGGDQRHWELGMIRGLTVTEEASAAAKRSADRTS